MARGVNRRAERLRFLRNVGLARGANGGDVARLQGFLRQLGYLDVEPGDADRDGFRFIRAHLSTPRATDAEFDEATERALRSYQAYHGLPPTGVLDVATAAQMSVPRCGFPDTPRDRRLASFTLQGNAWDRFNLTYEIAEKSDQFTMRQIREAVEQAFELWSAVTWLTFEEVAADGDIVIRFVRGDHNDGSPFDGPGRFLAHAFFPPPNSGPLAGDAHFDEDETWTVSLPAPDGGFDLVTVAAHEFGHALGLDHSQVPGALMWPTISGPQRFLTQDDIDGIQSLYGGRWTPLGDGASQGSSLAVAPNRDGRLEAFRADPNGGVQHNWQSSPGGIWVGWNQLDDAGATGTAIAVGRNSDGRLEVFLTGTGTDVWRNAQAAPSVNAWTGWTNLGDPGVQGARLAIASNLDGRLEVFLIDATNAIRHAWQVAPGGQWSGWEPIGDPAAQIPGTKLAVGRNLDGRLEVFLLSTGNEIWHAWQNDAGGAWSEWSRIDEPTVLGTDLDVGRNLDGRLHLFLVRTSGDVWQNAQISPGGVWSGWTELSLFGLQGTALAVGQNQDGRIEVFLADQNNDVWHSRQTVAGGAWIGWHRLGKHRTAALQLSVARNLDGRLQVFLLDQDLRAWHKWQLTPGGVWH